MAWYGYLAVYFVLWWIMLFIALPFGLRTQDDENEVVLGTPSSAPNRPHMLKVVIRTTIITTVLMALYYFSSYVLGYGLDNFPEFGPLARPTG